MGLTAELEEKDAQLTDTTNKLNKLIDTVSRQLPLLRGAMNGLDEVSDVLESQGIKFF